MVKTHAQPLQAYNTYKYTEQPVTLSEMSLPSFPPLPMCRSGISNPTKGFDRALLAPSPAGEKGGTTGTAANACLVAANVVLFRLNEV